MTYAPTEYLSFGSVDQLDELTHSMGWATEYRQLDPGIFKSTFTMLEDDSWFLMEEQSSHTVEVQAPAPDGMFVLALVEGTPGVVNGQALSSDHLFLQSPDSELRAILPANIKVTQIGIAAKHFEHLIRAVAPDLSMPLVGVNTIATTPESLTKIRQAMRTALITPSQRRASQEEIIAGILTGIVTTVHEHAETRSERGLHRATARRALDRAMSYIEAHLDGTVRIASVCRYAGVTSRTLERIFTRELAMSPQKYVKARRFNAVRRSLLAADREGGPRITEIATSHGFVHMGRFAVDYRHYFGESPRETLSSSRPCPANATAKMSYFG